MTNELDFRRNALPAEAVQYNYRRLLTRRWNKPVTGHPMTGRAATRETRLAAADRGKNILIIAEVFNIR